MKKNKQKVDLFNKSGRRMLNLFPVRKSTNILYSPDRTKLHKYQVAMELLLHQAPLLLLEYLDQS